MTPSLAVMWSREAGLYLSMREPGYFPLFPIAETDPRFHALTQRVYIIDVAQAPLVLWGPLCLDEERLHYRGLVAVALDATTICDDGDPDLWVVHRPYQFLRADAIEYRTWLLALAAHRDVWFSCDGASLVRLLEAAVNAAGELMIDVEQLVGQSLLRSTQLSASGQLAGVLLVELQEHARDRAARSAAAGRAR